MITTYDEYRNCIRRLADALDEIFASELSQADESLVEIQDYIVKLETALKSAKEHRSGLLEVISKTAEERLSVWRNLQKKEYALINIKALALLGLNKAVPDIGHNILKLETILEELNAYDPEC